MKKVLSFALMLSLSLVVAQNAFADESADATAHVYMDVVANIGLSADTPNVDAGDIQTGDFSADFTFRVDANTEAVSMSLAASELWKGDDPLGTEVPPIPLNLTEGIPTSCQNANPILGGTSVLAYIGPAARNIDGFPAEDTAPVVFESSQDGHFSQSCTNTVTWTQSDHEKPMGEYSGKVRLTAMIVPPTI